MTSIVRKNIVTLSATFSAENGSATQPSAANAVLAYIDQSGITRSVTVPMVETTTTLNGVTISTWVGNWDSSVSGGGTVSWMVWGYGTLQAAAEGCFEIEANAANTV